MVLLAVAKPNWYRYMLEKKPTLSSKDFKWSLSLQAVILSDALAVVGQIML